MGEFCTSKKFHCLMGTKSSATVRCKLFKSDLPMLT